MSEQSQRPVSQVRSYLGFAGFILPHRVLGRSSTELHRTRIGKEEFQDLLYVTQTWESIPACRAY